MRSRRRQHDRRTLGSGLLASVRFTKNALADRYGTAGDCLAEQEEALAEHKQIATTRLGGIALAEQEEALAEHKQIVAARLGIALVE